MTRIVFTQDQQLDLTRRLQLLVLDSMAASGNWLTNDSVRFQGGTCLSLSYGSSRFSEDLDFVLGTDKGLQRMMTGAQVRLANTLRVSLPGASVRFVPRDESLESPDARNPRVFNVVVTHPDWYRTIKVKVEFWVADPDAVRKYEAKVLPAQVLTQALEGVPLRMTVAPVMLPTATLTEVLVDKLHALACRPYLKHRDIFDLWWLRQQSNGANTNWAQELCNRYPVHAKMYNDSPSLAGLADVLREKSKAVRALVGKPEFAVDLARWLGETASMASQASADFIADSVATEVDRLCASPTLANCDIGVVSPDAPIEAQTRLGASVPGDSAPAAPVVGATQNSSASTSAPSTGKSRSAP